MLPGPVLPGLVDAHSHAFQRAFVGLSERRASEADDFWSWRERMYRVAPRITPGHRLDALVFAGTEPALREVLVAGTVVLRDGRHDGEDAIADAFARAMGELWHDPAQCS